jgi:hypothetical protein
MHKDKGGPGAQGKKAAHYLPEKRRIETVTWPGTEKETGLLYLSCKEAQDAYFDARDWFDKRCQPVDSDSAEQLALEVRYQSVYRMLVDPELKNPNERIFASMASFRARMTPTLAEWFMEKHLELQSEEVGELYDQEPSVEMQAVAALFGIDGDKTADEIIKELAPIAVAVRDNG